MEMPVIQQKYSNLFGCKRLFSNEYILTELYFGPSKLWLTDTKPIQDIKYAYISKVVKITTSIIKVQLTMGNQMFTAD